MNRIIYTLGADYLPATFSYHLPMIQVQLFSWHIMSTTHPIFHIPRDLYEPAPKKQCTKSPERLSAIQHVNKRYEYLGPQAP